MFSISEKINRFLFPTQLSQIERMMAFRKKCKEGNKFIKLIYRLKYKRCCKHYGCFIPLSSDIGSNIAFPHGAYGVFISQGAKIGDNCIIFHHVTIGSNTLKDSKNYGSPTIGDNVYIGAGAKIIGNVRVGDNVRIGANAIVVKDIPDNATIVAPESIVINHNTPRENTFTTFNTKEK